MSKSLECDLYKLKILKKNCLTCGVCGAAVHNSCVNLADDTSNAIKKGMSGVYWYCKGCEKGVVALLNEFSKLEKRVENAEIEIQSINGTLEQQNAEIVSIKASLSALENASAKPQSWSDAVRRQIDQNISEVKVEMQAMKQTISNTQQQVTEEKDKANRANNIIIHRAPESLAEGLDDQKKDDNDLCNHLLTDALGVDCGKDGLKRIVRLGKRQDSARPRPILIEFHSAATKNLVIESLSKLRNADEIYKKLSITHDMTPSERDELKTLVSEARTKQASETSGEWIFRVRGPPGSLKIVKIKRRC